MKVARRSVLALAVIGALVVAAAPAGASVASAKNGCKYLKKGEVAEAIGRPVKKGDKPAGPPQTRVCAYELAEEGAIGSVNLWVDSSSRAKLEYGGFRRTFGDDSTPVPELGKKAFYAGGGLNTLYVLRDGVLVYVQYTIFNPPDPAAVQTAVEEMTKIVLGRV